MPERFWLKTSMNQGSFQSGTDQGDLVLVDDEGDEFEITLLKMNVVRVD